MEGAIGLAIVAGIVIVWYLIEHVFNEVFDAVWAGLSRLFRRKPKASRPDKSSSTGLLMTRQEPIDKDGDNV